MAKIETGKKTGIEEAVALSRQLPQLGLPPEVSLQNSLTNHAKQSETHHVTTKSQTYNPNSYKWGVFSAISDYLDGKL